MKIRTSVSLAGERDADSMDERKTSLVEEAAPSGSALTVSAQRADELFLEGPKSRLVGGLIAARNGK